MPNKVEVTGKREVLKAFSRLDSLVDDLSDATGAIGSKLVDDVRGRTRRRTGTLAESWIAEGEADRASFSNSQSYAPVQEFGSDALSIEPTNAVRLAFEDNKDDIRDELEDAIRERAKRANIRTRN